MRDAQLRGAQKGRSAKAAQPSKTPDAAAQPAVYEEPTPLIEKLLMAVTIMILPLEAQIPNVGGFSIMFLMFGVLLTYAILFRIGALLKMAVHPVFLTSYLMLAVGYTMETFHPNSDDTQLTRIAQMVFGGVLIAALCLKRSTLRAALYGFVIAGGWLSFTLLITSYGALRGASAANFVAATVLRARVYEDSPLHNNLNTLSFVAAQGATVALAWALTAADLRRRNIFFGITFLCALGAFLPLSRSGILLLIVSLLVVLLTYRGNRSRALSMMIFLGVGIMLASPDAAFSRLSYSTQKVHGRMEGRARIYTAAIEHFSDYAVEGVGAGNFWSSWGKANGFGDWGAHNCFIQVMIYWGMPGLVLLLAVIWRTFRCLPKTQRDDAMVLALYGVGISLILHMLTTHTLYAKEFALGLGLIAALRYSLPAQAAQGSGALQNAPLPSPNNRQRAPLAAPMRPRRSFDA